MESCRNVLFDLVVHEIKLQVIDAGRRMRQQFNFNEITVHVLNQLPCIYVSTEHNWQIQTTNARNQYRSQIEDEVCYALENLWINPFRNDTVHYAEQDLPARSLLRLQASLGNENLTWKLLPKSVEIALEQELTNGRCLTVSPNSPKLSQEYESYLLPGKINCFNALRLLIVRLALQKLSYLPQEILSRTRLEDVVAEALNQLPPMYANNAESLMLMRQKARQDLGSKFERAVDLAVQNAKKEFFNQPPLLLFHKIKAERRQAMIALKDFFQDPQVNWRSCNDYFDNAQGEARHGKVVWLRK
jgi:Late competence development protein ComFB